MQAAPEPGNATGNPFTEDISLTNGMETAAPSSESAAGRAFRHALADPPEGEVPAPDPMQAAPSYPSFNSVGDTPPLTADQNISTVQAPSRMGGPLDFFEPDDSRQLAAGSPPAQYPSGHTEPAVSETAVAVAVAVASALVLGYVTRKYGRLRGSLMMILKKRAAAVICAGLAVMAIGGFARYGSSYNDTVFEQALRDGYVAIFGAVLAILGAYFWLTTNPVE